jgi:hypothetical protein
MHDPPGSASASRRAATLTPSIMISAKLMPIRNRMRQSSETSASRSIIAHCTSTAQRMTSMTLPILRANRRQWMRLRCPGDFRSNNSRRCACREGRPPPSAASSRRRLPGRHYICASGGRRNAGFQGGHRDDDANQPATPDLRAACRGRGAGPASIARAGRAIRAPHAHRRSADRWRTSYLVEFVSSFEAIRLQLRSKDRTGQRDWQESRFSKVPGDEPEWIPLPI